MANSVYVSKTISAGIPAMPGIIPKIPVFNATLYGTDIPLNMACPVGHGNHVGGIVDRIREDTPT